jgi:CDGSH-type Zn-finger protein
VTEDAPAGGRSGPPAVRVLACRHRLAGHDGRMSRAEVVITPYRDGPLLVRGPVRLTDQDGREIELDRATVALCRCGKSRMRPFCDGSHKVVRFKAPSGPEQGRSE